MQSASHAEKPLGAKSVAHATRLDCTLLAAVGARRVRMQQRGWRLVVGDRVAQVERCLIGEKLANRHPSVQTSAAKTIWRASLYISLRKSAGTLITK